MMAFIRAFMLFIATLFIFAWASPAFAATDIFGGACNGQAASSPTCQKATSQTGQINNNPISGKNGVIQRATNLLAVVGGIAAVIIIIIGGIMFVTSGGSINGAGGANASTGAKNARTLVINGVIGLIILALAWVLVSFIIQRVVG